MIGFFFMFFRCVCDDIGGVNDCVIGVSDCGFGIFDIDDDDVWECVYDMDGDLIYLYFL